MNNTTFASIMIACGAIILGFCSMMPTPPPTGALLEVRAEREVRARLKAPSTAKFPGQAKVAFNGTEKIVTGFVDSQNAFGAMLRSSYIVTFTLHCPRAEDRYDCWRLSNVSIGRD